VCRLGEGELADAAETFAVFYEYMGLLNVAQDIFQTLISWRKANLGPDDPALLRSTSFFTEVLRLQKNFKEAERLDRHVFGARRKILGDDHVDTLWSAHDLGWDLEALGDVERAESLQRLAAEGREKVLGPAHPLTLQSINNLAHTLRRQGKSIEALRLMRRTKDTGEKIFPPHHSELLMFMGNLQDVLRYQGFLDEAEAMARESYKGTCLEWGVDHIKAAQSRGQLKDILWDLNKADEAEFTARENLALMEASAYSTDVSSIDDIALLIDTLSVRQINDGIDRSPEILSFVHQALAKVDKLPPDILKLPSTLQDLIYLAMGLEVLNAHEELAKLEPVLFSACKEVFGISNQNTINSLIRLSTALRAQGKYEAAEDLCKSAIRQLNEKLSQSEADGGQPAHLAALSSLAIIFKHIGDHRKVMEIWDDAYNHVTSDGYIQKADYETLYSIQGLAEDIDDQSRHSAAETLHRAVLATRRSRYGTHPCVDDSLYALSWNLRQQNRLSEAEAACQEALAIALEFRGQHRNTICILKRLAHLQERQGKHDEAEEKLRGVLAGFRRLGSRHVTRITEALEDLQELLMGRGRWAEVRPLIVEAIGRREGGWDRSPGHYAGLMKHLAIAMWEMGEREEGLRVYREARRRYEEAWGIGEMADGERKEDLLRRLAVLLPGTGHAAREERLEAKEDEEEVFGSKESDGKSGELTNKEKNEEAYAQNSRHPVARDGATHTRDFHDARRTILKSSRDLETVAESVDEDVADACL